MTRVSPRLTPRPAAATLAVLAAVSLGLDARAGLVFRQVPTLPGATATALASDGTTVWAGTPRGVWKLSAGAWTPGGLAGLPVLSLVSGSAGLGGRRDAGLAAPPGVCADSGRALRGHMGSGDASGRPHAAFRARDRRFEPLGRGPRRREEVGRDMDAAREPRRQGPLRGGLERRPRRGTARQRRAIRGRSRLVPHDRDAGHGERAGARVGGRRALGRHGPDALFLERLGVGRGRRVRVPRRAGDHERRGRPPCRDGGRGDPEEVRHVGARQRRHPRARRVELRGGRDGPVRGHGRRTRLSARRARRGAMRARASGPRRSRTSRPWPGRRWLRPAAPASAPSRERPAARSLRAAAT